MSAHTSNNPIHLTPFVTAKAKTALQVSATTILALVAGATFGIWQGLGAADFSAAAFVAVHQALVRGLNVTLPVMGAGAAALILALAWAARNNKPALRRYLAAFALSVAAGLITRLWNQPINAQVMGWTVETLPANWIELRASWWQGHVIRTMLTIAAAVNLTLAIMADRSGTATGPAL